MNFSSTEVIVDEVVNKSREADFFIVDFKRVLTVDSDALCYELDIDDFDAMMAGHSPVKARVLENLLRIFSRNLRKANTEIGVLN